MMNINDFISKHFTFSNDNPEALADGLNQSMLYSLNSGGKRFRPMVISLISDALSVSESKYLPFAAAIECVHTYSLIHDDLPSMDNDSMRRGKPTNHVVYGEATALLAGDGLLTEAFRILSTYYSGQPEVGLNLVRVLSQAAGPVGMVAGQFLDMQILKDSSINYKKMLQIHKLKTAALIKACAEGVGWLALAPNNVIQKLSVFGEKLGLAFQLKDDILDHDPQKPEVSNLVTILGTDTAQKQLLDLTEECLKIISDLKIATQPLKDLVLFNQNRDH